MIELNLAGAVAMDDGGGTRLIDTILARGDRGAPPGALGAGGPVPAALEIRPEIIATADIGCYAYPRRETRVPVVHGTGRLVWWVRSPTSVRGRAFPAQTGIP